MSSNIRDDEVIIGVHSSGVELVEGLNTSISRNYCTKCNHDIHCRVIVDRETKEAIIEKNCSNDSCRCSCRTKYPCRICGNLHFYGKKCNRVEIESVRNPEYDKLFQEIIGHTAKIPEAKT